MHRTRLALLPALLAVPLLAGLAPSADKDKDGPPSKSALEADPKGWTDLLAKGMSDWKRVPIPPGSKLNKKDPWKLDADKKLLVCDGVGVHEMLLYDKEFADGVFHVEWRFKPVEGKKGYNSGVYVRNSADGRIWHQAQVGDRNVGFIFGDTAVPGEEKLKRINTGRKGPQRGLPAGEWSTFEITCKGKTLTLWVNGHVTSEWNECQVPKGYVGMEAEGWYIEFRNVKFRSNPR